MFQVRMPLRSQCRSWAQQVASTPSTLRTNFGTLGPRYRVRDPAQHILSDNTTGENEAHHSFPSGPLDPLPLPLDHPAWWQGPLHEVRDRLKRASVDLPNMRSSHLCYPPPDQGIPKVREELEKRPWGFVTYRTAYGGHSDRQFLKLRGLIDVEIREYQADEGKYAPMGEVNWPVVENKALLRNVTTQTVRELFMKWTADRGVPPTEDGWDYQVARFHYCLIADRRSVQSAETTRPFIGVVYKDWVPAWHPDRIGDGDKYVPGDWTPIEGNPDGVIGWFYSPISSLIWYYDAMCVEGLWGKKPWLPYKRPPNVSNETTDLRKWRGDKAEGHDRRPSLSKLSD
ncbi:hypothetical protein NM208_g5361 [Fusarium decemcellulare]|uniref:Uncharacterized protein n=1 Tax=Fusarium decemcellulare TaxID=57161 RepID=A0ACC1SH79_9HYPO|nr:hypothetical protein NM208_g5361 [Fusarium decemcellulare]